MMGKFVVDRQDDTLLGARLRAWYDRLIGAIKRSPSASGPAARQYGEGMPSRIGRYAVEREVGRGGMGVVYAARDELLNRTVAVKTMSALDDDETARQRFWREARSAASVNHPNICQIYEVGEDGGRLFIAMEFLDGESLADRLRGGPLSVSDALPIGLGLLSALSALHGRGLVHRDLKPSNIFLTEHGIKLLDFGLARSQHEQTAGASAALTRTGIVVGTPRYMAPEQITGDPVDARCDLFAAGAILFEMVAGRPPFQGRTVSEILHATLSEQPPALTGSPAVAAIDRVIRRALAKRPSDRPDSAEAFASELRQVQGLHGDDTPVMARALTRIVVLPFRSLRPDPETDFLVFSLPDAIATSLSGIGSLVVRSSATGARRAGEAPDLKALAAEADVDRVVTGTVLRSSDQLRVSVQLVEAPGGTLLASQTVQSSLGDLFHLQDELARLIVQSLSLPLVGTASPAPDVPQSAIAYEFYLRGNELARAYVGLPHAREMYQRSLELDAGFAPAWAQLGRCHRVIGKYIEATPDSEARAEEAFRRALELNPRLSVAHKFYANLEADLGQAERAMVRLLGEARRRGNDPELFAGLVHACRYCGLLDESLAAHEEARRLDPNIPTSAAQTALMAGDIPRVLALETPRVVAGADDVIRVIALGLDGRRDEARQALEATRLIHRIPTFDTWRKVLEAWLDRRAEDVMRGMSGLGGLRIEDDPEAMFQEGWLLCDVGVHERGLPCLRGAVSKGYFAASTLTRARQFDTLRRTPEFLTLVAEAEAGRARMLATFRATGGERLLGIEVRQPTTLPERT